MVSWDVAVMAMIAISAVGFLLADGEKRRVRWVRAMRRCLLRMSSIIRYEQPGLAQLLVCIDLRGSQQEKELTQLLHRCAARMSGGKNALLAQCFASEAARLPGYGVLSEEDRLAFEGLLADLGKSRLPEQLRLIDSADERLRVREETLQREGMRRARMIRTLGVSCGAAAFLILI